MGKVSLADIRLREYDLESLPLLGRLREATLRATPEICIERASLITRHLREVDDREPAELRYAGAVRHFLSRKEPLFFDDSLLAGTTTSKFFGAPVYPELTGL